MDTELLWALIKKHQGKVIYTTWNKRLTYSVKEDVVEWQPLEPSLKRPWNQSKKEIMLCVDARQRGLGPGDWPGTATSYKWALLNDESIWPTRD